MKTKLLNVCSVLILFALSNGYASDLESTPARDLDLDHNISSNIDKAATAEASEQEKVVAGRQQEGGWETEDLTEDSEKLGLTVYMEERVNEGNQTCNPSKDALDFKIFRFFTRKSQGCMETVENVDENARERIKNAYDKDVDSGMSKQDASRLMADRLNALASKTYKINKFCATSYLQGQYVGLRLNWLQNIDSIKRKRSCETKWKEQIEQRSGECKTELRSAYEKYEKALKLSPENRPASQNTQIMEYISKLVTWSKGCSKAKLSSKNKACREYVDTLKENTVVCNFKNFSESDRGQRNSFINLLSDPRLDKQFVSEAFSLILGQFIPDANAGKVWDEMRKDKQNIQAGVVENQNSTHGLLYSPYHRGALYIATIEDKSDGLGIYDKISLENAARSNAIKNVSDNLNTGVSPILNSGDKVLDDLLNLDPRNPGELSLRNLGALDSISGEICSRTPTACGRTVGNNSLNVSEEVLKKVLKMDPNFGFVFKNLKQLTNATSKGRPFSKEAILAHKNLDAFHKRRVASKDKITKSKYNKMAKLAGYSLPDNDFKTFEKIKLGFKKKAEGNGFAPRLGVAANKDQSGNKNGDQNNIEGTQNSNTVSKAALVGSGGGKAVKKTNVPEDIKFNWNDPGGDYYEQTEREVAEIVKNGEMPANAGIESDKSRNIFNIISRRYILSGWKKLQLTSDP